MMFNNKKTIAKSTLKISDIRSVSLINKITEIHFESIIDSQANRSKIDQLDYIAFDGSYKSDGIKVLVVLINDKISSLDLSLLSIKLETLKKNYIYQVIRKTTGSSINSAQKHYKDEKDIQNTIIDKSKWETYFNNILEKSIELKTSDIHITADKETGTAIVKARVYGDLTEIDSYTYDDMLRLISSAYNKLASKDSKDQQWTTNNTHETGIRLLINHKVYNLRFISKPIYPSGSFDVTMRLIDEGFYQPLETLGYSKFDVARLRKSAGKPTGLLTFAGGVGSGKSSSTHSICTDYIHRAKHLGVITKKLVTFESPVEYKIPGAMQVEYKRDNSRTPEQQISYYNSQVQSLLRMDTNAVLLGEIREKNGAQTVVELVQSDNIVLTTVHAQSALKIFNRLNNLGIEKEVLTEPNFLLALVYQTLVKVPCKHCASSIDDDRYNDIKERIQTLIKLYDLKLSLLNNIKIINIKGCAECSFGVIGRTLIAEIVEPTIEILDELKIGNFNQAYSLWREYGGITYQEHALEKILKGEICPLAYEDKVQSLADTGFYADIDSQRYATVLNDVDWGDDVS